MAKSRITDVETFQVGDRVHTFIGRHAHGQPSAGRWYTHLAGSSILQRLARAVYHTGLQGHVQMRPWMGGGTGWGAYIQHS